MRRILVLFLSFSIVFSQFFLLRTALASATTGGWNVGSAVAQGATTVYTATKEIGGKLVTSVAKITPTPAQIAKGLGKGLFAGLALSVAQKLIEDGVDFLLDPANNELRYKTTKNCSGNSCPYFYSNYFDDIKYTSSSSAADALFKIFKAKTPSLVSYKFFKTEGDVDYYSGFFENNPDPNNSYIQVRKTKNLSYDDKNTKSIPLTQLASSIIGEANNNNQDAKAITSAVAQSATASNTDDQLVPYTQLTQALDASVPTSQDDTKSSPSTNTNTGSQSQTQDQSKPDESASNPTATPQAPEIPAACSWMPSVCQMADTFIKEVPSFFEWAKKDELPEKEKIDIDQNPTLSPKSVDIKWAAQCPAPVKATFDINGISQEITIVDYKYICDQAPIISSSVIFSSSLAALYIVFGRRGGSSDD